MQANRLLLIIKFNIQDKRFRVKNAAHLKKEIDDTRLVLVLYVLSYLSQKLFVAVCKRFINKTRYRLFYFLK